MYMHEYKPNQLHCFVQTICICFPWWNNKDWESHVDGKILFGYQKQFKVLKKQEKAQQGADTGPEKHIWTFIHLLFAEASS